MVNTPTFHGNNNITFSQWVEALIDTGSQYWNNIDVAYYDEELSVYYYNKIGNETDIVRACDLNDLISSYPYNVGHAEYQLPPSDEMILASYSNDSKDEGVSEEGRAQTIIMEEAEHYLTNVREEYVDGYQLSGDRCVNVSK